MMLLAIRTASALPGGMTLRVMLKKLGTPLLKRPFRARPPARDRETDLVWARTLRSSCEDIARKIEVELDGLRSRHAQASDQALGRLGDDDAGGFARSKDDEALLVAAEREMLRAEARMRHLRQQAAHLVQITAMVDAWPLTDIAASNKEAAR